MKYCRFCVAYTIKMHIECNMTSVCNSTDGNDNAENAIAGKHHYKTDKKLSSILTEYFCDL